ncbi:MAG: arylsulfatase [Phycisphaerales bacterium]|nr:arylsulfatase [Phycisphaerales bacterium]
MAPMLLLLGLLVNGSAANPEVQDRPNVVIIMTDDQGHGDLGVQGHPVLKTPRIDALAGESATVGAFYVHPVCTPTRAALFTGRHPQRTTAIDTWIGRAMLEPDEITIAERLRDAGYATGIFGKWHLGDCHPMRPMDQGFDVSVVHRGGGIAQPADPEGGEGRYTDPILLRNGFLESFEGWCTDVYVDEMTAWMAKQDTPFFAVLTTNAPHGPFHDVPIEEYERYKAMDLEPTGASNHDRMARILAMDANIDENVGRILDTLERLGVADDTLVLYLHDNGADHDGYSAGLRGRKGTVYEGGVRTPFYARWPGRIPSGVRSDAVGMHLDLAPTILEACGVEDSDGRLDGRSLLGILEAREVGDPERPIIIQAHRGDAPVEWSNAMIRAGRWKLVNPSGFGRELPDGESAPRVFELYDVLADPSEANDLFAAEPAIATRLQAQYEAWFEDVDRGGVTAYLPPPISLGATTEPVWLTRQDWRRTRKGGWGGRSDGYWRVEPVTSGPFRVGVRRLDGQALPQRVVLRFDGEVVAEAKVESDDATIIIDSVSFPSRIGRLTVEMQDASGRYGAYQVSIEIVVPVEPDLHD